MTPERIVALVVGGLAIVFGFMLLPYADALRRRMLKRREPPYAGLRILTFGIPHMWRNHALSWMFILCGAVLVAFAVLSRD